MINALMDIAGLLAFVLVAACAVVFVCLYFGENK